MNHIEFFGPPGAGKTTLFQQLITAEEVYGGVAEDAISRIVHSQEAIHYRLQYRLMPDPIKRFFEEKFIQYRFADEVLPQFIKEHPTFLETVVTAMNAVSHEPEAIFKFCKRSAEQYQLGAATVTDDEIFCLDEGFVQRAFAIRWRGPDDSFSMEEYFAHVPTPDLVVYVDAPVEVCLNRQRERERVTVEKEWEVDNPHAVQEKAHKQCERLCDELPTGTTIVTVDNGRDGTFNTKRLREVIAETYPLTD